MPQRQGPLSGYKVIELAGIGPGPYTGQLLADYGADVVVVDRPSPDPGPGKKAIDARGKRSIILDLRNPDGTKALLALVKTADVLIEGLRPGVTERLGIGPEQCHAVNPKLVYGRMTGWGQSGPWSQMAGHDINYISMTGILNAIGKDGEVPAVPLNMIGDFGGGSMFLVAGILAALIAREKSGKGDIIDAAIVDGASSLMSFVYGMHGQKLWQTAREANLLDGGAPFYRCYKTSDDKFVAVGCIEPQFFAAMMKKLPADQDAYGEQHDRARWPEQHKMLEDIFSCESRDHWEQTFALTDACVTPVLDYVEAASHPANTGRSAHVPVPGWLHPQIAPRLASQQLAEEFDIPAKGGNLKDVLTQAGYDDAAIAALLASGGAAALARG
ncbi:MAG: CaiB/BaiF CoA-transferase family protein [Sphingorhabdus sp.]